MIVKYYHNTNECFDILNRFTKEGYTLLYHDFINESGDPTTGKRGRLTFDIIKSEGVKEVTLEDVVLSLQNKIDDLQNQVNDSQLQLDFRVSQIESKTTITDKIKGVFGIGQ